MWLGVNSVTISPLFEHTLLKTQVTPPLTCPLTLSLPVHLHVLGAMSYSYPYTLHLLDKVGESSQSRSAIPPFDPSVEGNE